MRGVAPLLQGAPSEGDGENYPRKEEPRIAQISRIFLCGFIRVIREIRAIRGQKKNDPEGFHYTLLESVPKVGTDCF